MAAGGIFKPPDQPNEAYNWPAYVDQETGEIEDGGYTEMFWRAIEAVPSKARHENFHLSVLGRMPPIWRLVAKDLLLIVLLTRDLPDEFMPCSRLPIPKAKPGQTRPLALTHDACGFLWGVVGNWLNEANIKAGDANPDLVAYKAGRGCDDITLVDIAAREDAVASGKVTVKDDTDETKMFDRISLNLQMVGLEVIGCPKHGFMEMKASDLDGRIIFIIVREGIVIAKQDTGLLQGSTFSVFVANPVMQLKHAAMRLVRSRPQDGPLRQMRP